MIIKQSRMKMFAMGLGCFGAAWLCGYALDAGWIVGRRSAGKINFASYLFIAIGIFGLLKALLMRALVAEIKPNGLYAPGISKQLIAWSDIEAINAYKHSGSESLAISFFAGSQAEANAKTSAYIGKAITTVTGFKGYTLPLGATGISAQRFMEGIRDVMESKPSVAAPRKTGVVTHTQPTRFGKRVGA